MSASLTAVEQRIRSARETVAAAQRELDEAMAQLAVVEPVEKTMITEVLRTAFDNLAAARTALETVSAKPKR